MTTVNGTSVPKTGTSTRLVPSLTPVVVSSATPTAVPSEGTSESIATGTMQPSATPRPTVGMIPTVVSDVENPVIELTTGLGVKKTVEYAEAETGNVTLDYVLSRLQWDLGCPHILFKIEEVVYMFVPLRAFNHAYREAGTDHHVIVLADGTQLTGVLSTLLEDSGGETYDLGTAERVQLVSLPEDNSSIETEDQQQEDRWVLELSADRKPTYTISNPRFVFVYAHMTFGGSYQNHSAWTHKFHVVDEHEVSHLANVGDFDEIRIDTAVDYGPDAVTVRAGETETSGTIMVVSDNLEEESASWFLVADLVDSDAAIALSGQAGPLLTLRRLTGQQP